MAEGWRASAYGLALEGEGEDLGLEAGPAAPGRPVVVRAMGAAELDAGWPPGGRRLATEHAEPDLPPRTIDEHDESGWRLDAPGWGLARVARDGAAIDCARGDAEGWRWQRFFVGRVLPFAAVAAGYEALHASAVVVNGRALALSGPSGAGKSSVAAALALRGHPLLTDDVLALECAGTDLIGHPGPPVLAVRDGEAALLGPERIARLGASAGRGGGKTYVAAPGITRPVPVARVALLERTGAAGGVEVRAMAPTPRMLLSALFVPELRTAERAVVQLEVLGLLGERAEFVGVRAGTEASADDVAEALLG
jgi:hypothetical protein